jgi:4-carboxymuconolactone decarboxylase
MGLSRLTMIERDALPEDQRRFYDAVRALRRRPITGPFIVTMNSSPDLAARFAHLGHYFHARGQADESIVSLRVRGFIALLGARALDGQYEWAAWVNWAIDAGVPRETADAIRERRTPPNLTAEESLVTDLSTQMISGNHRVQPATCQAALEHFGVQGLVEVVLTLGYFAMIALPLNAFDMEMSSEQKGNRAAFTPLAVSGRAGTVPGFQRSDVPPIAGTETTTPRVRPLVRHDDVAPEHQHFLDRIVRTRGWISPVFQVLLHAADVAERVANVGDFLLYESIIPPAIRALTWLIAARELDCNYAWDAAAGPARKAGVGDAIITGLQQGKPLTGLTTEQRVLFDYCHQLLRGNHHVTDETYREAVATFGVPAAVQIAATLGYFVMMGLVANAFEVPTAGDESRPAL